MAIITVPTSVGGVAAQGQLGKTLNGPLSALFGGKGVETIKYPSDLATEATQNHYVQFSIKEVIPSKYEVDYSHEGAHYPAPGQSAATTIPGQHLGLPNFSNGLDSLLKMLTPDGTPEIIKQGINGAKSFVTGVVGNGLKISPQTTSSRAFISLYMPDTLNASYNAQYAELSLTADNTLNTLRMVDQLGGSMSDYSVSGEGLDGLLNRAGAAITTDPSVAWMLTHYGSELMGRAGFNAENIQSLLLKGQGYALNPQLQMIYKGIDLRSFSLSFTFSPRSAKESDNVNHILYLFKRSFAPRLQPGKETSTDSMFLVAPDIFNVSFNLGGHENHYLPRYGDCVLVGIDINYAPNGWAAYGDGSPVQTHLTLQFREIEIVTREKLDSGQGYGKTKNSGTIDTNGVAGESLQLDSQTITYDRGLR